MGINREEQMEQAEPKAAEDSPTPNNDVPSNVQPDPPENTELLRSYKCPTGSKQPDGAEKGVPSKWSKMNAWRKALSEDAAEKGATSGDTTKQSRLGMPRKNPFRRALSEPPGALNTVAPPAAAASPQTPGPSPGDTPGGSTQDGQATGGGARFVKYIRTVSQKFKKPRLQGRKSAPVQQSEAVSNEVSAPVPNATEPLKFSWAPPQEVPVWDIRNCLLRGGQIHFSREDEPMLRIRYRASSCLSSLSLQNLTDSQNNFECSPDNVATGTRAKAPDGGVRGLIKRRLQGAGLRKSNTQINTIGTGVDSSRISGSRESLSIAAVENLDLSSDQNTVIRPVHSSILGEKYCFEVINAENNYCFGCNSAAERDRWIEDLRRAAQPNKDNCERIENSLSVWVNEAKDLPPKKRYYCELHLDGTLYARTSSLSSESSVGSSGGAGGSGVAGAGGCQLFWGELLQLDNLPPVTQLSLHLFREDDKKKRHSKDESSLHPLGSVAIPVDDIKGRAFQEKWYPIIPYKPPGSGSSKELLGAQASLRVKARYQNLRVLPIEKYKEFAEFVTMNYMQMCSSLEPLLQVREKEELAGALVHVLQSIGQAKAFLIALGSAELQRFEEKEALIFRENTLATKAIDEYMKLVGQKYLIETLGDFIARLYISGESWEVEPSKCSDLQTNQRLLREGCEEVVKKITMMHESFPVELNDIFSNWVEECNMRGREEIGQRLISASLFLRFLCPAILSPSLFGLTESYPAQNTLRTLTLTAKVIQNLANFTLFGEKEEYMLFMNDFLEQHWEDMRGFLQSVSCPDSDLPMAHFDGYVDLPLRLAVLHNLLVDIIFPMKQETVDMLHPLPSILNRITESLGPNVPRIQIHSFTKEESKPDYVPPRKLSHYSPLHNSVQQLQEEQSDPYRRKRVKRTQSVPDRIKLHKPPKVRQMSSEDLPQTENQDVYPQISSPNNPPNKKTTPTQVPWVVNKDFYPPMAKQEEFNILEKHDQELSELRLNLEQVIERETEMANRLEDFINQTQAEKEQLQAEIQHLHKELVVRDEQLASAMFRLGVVEEEREETEKKLLVAMAAADRVNVLEEQFAELLRDVHRISMDHEESQGNIQLPDPGLSMESNAS